jgi:hypothetical protein
MLNLSVGVALLLTSAAFASKGVDVSSATYVDAWKCLKGRGYDFAVIRAFQSNGVPDPVAPHTVYNAWDGGMNDVQLYFFPCPRCGDAAGQMRSMVDNLAKYNVSFNSRYGPPHTYSKLWMDVEGPQYWLGSASENVKFLKELVSAAESHGISVGIYVSEYEHSSILGGDRSFSNLDLWYPHYDGMPGFSDFAPFGGWTKPYAKQFDGTTDECGASVDLNYK